jgi:hypothetical protein
VGRQPTSARQVDEARKVFRQTPEKSGATGGHRSLAAEAGKYRRDVEASRAFQEFSRQWATEAYRILRPGGYLVSFASTRTYHRMVCGIEDAGFEIRDQLGWMFGSGFPKSKNKDGRGTALKPGWEPIVLARKPIEGNVETNFAKWGTGLLESTTAESLLRATTTSKRRKRKTGTRISVQGRGRTTEFSARRNAIAKTTKRPVAGLRMSCTTEARGA